MNASTSTSAAAPRLSHASAALVGAAVLGGWALLDLYIVLRSSEPRLALDLLPSTLMVLGCGALLGPLLGRRPALALVGAPALALTSKLPAFTAVHFDSTELALIRMVMLAWIGVAGIGLLAPRLEIGPLRAALCLGALAAVMQTNYRLPAHAGQWYFIVSACAALALGLLRRPAWRRGLTLLALTPALSQAGQQVLWPRNPMREDLPPPTATAPPAAPNLLLIVIDTLRADHMGAYGYELRDTTPGLDAFAREHATLYTQARATSSYTLSSHASLLTGLQAVEHGATHPRPRARALRPEVTTLAERLRAIGYETAGIVANGYYLCEELGIDRGFEHFDDCLGGLTQPGPGMYISLGQMTGAQPAAGRTGHRTAERITELSLDWLDRRRDGPFFLTLNYLEVHAPYLPPPPFSRAFSSEQPRDFLSPELDVVPLLYDRELLYVDHEITRLLDELEARGVFEDTIVVVTSDHGEALGERGFPEHCWTLYDNVVRVPLLIKPAGPRRVAVDDRRLSGADAHDLMLRELGLLGADERTSRVDASLIGEWRGEEHSTSLPGWADAAGIDLVTAVISWFDGARKVIVRSNGEVEAFDLAVDPHELHPLPLSDDYRASALARAKQWWSTHPPDPLEHIEYSEATLDGMRALGYLGGEEYEE